MYFSVFYKKKNSTHLLSKVLDIFCKDDICNCISTSEMFSVWMLGSIAEKTSGDRKLTMFTNNWNKYYHSIGFTNLAI